jgi:endonuclease-3
MTKEEKSKRILGALEKEFPEARIALTFSNPLELLIATILSAQCTDERVNKVTPSLFNRFKNAKEYAEADLHELEEIIRPTGFFKNKAKSIIGCCKKIVSDFNGAIPETVEAFTALPGVGRKTANVVLGSAFGQDAIAVDTHVKRVSQRLGLTQNQDPDKIEKDLQEIISKDWWTKTTILFILHGRHTCKARNPQCNACPIQEYCSYYKDKTL